MNEGEVFGQEVGYIWFNLQQFGLTWKIMDSYVVMGMDLVGQVTTMFGQFWKGKERFGQVIVLDRFGWGGRVARGKP